jgi:hypothetical protein
MQTKALSKKQPRDEALFQFSEAGFAQQDLTL